MSMRKIVAFILITCTTAISFAQEIKGIADFKIGMSLEEFKDLPLIKGKNIDVFDGYENLTDIRRFQFEAPIGVEKSGNIDYPYNIKVKFYKGKLATIWVNDAGFNFEKILIDKYGQPIKEDKTKHVTCQNGYGAQSSHLDGSRSLIWGKGKKISATLDIDFFDCGSGRVFYYVEEKAIAKVMSRIEQNARETLQAKDEKAKASASKL